MLGGLATDDEQALAAPQTSFRPPLDAVFHVTSSLNQESILAHGFDWSPVGAARGIADSLEPQQEGCFLVLREFKADWFIRMNNSGGPVDG